MKRPLGVTIIFLLVLTIGGLSLIRFFQSVRQWDLLNEILPFSPLYLATNGLVWFIVSLVTIWGILRKKSWTVRLIQGAVILYSLVFWIDRIWLTALESRINNDTFAAIGTVILLIYILGTLSSRKVRAYFGVSDE